MAKIEEYFNILAIDTVSWLVANIGYIIFGVTVKQARVLRAQPPSYVDPDLQSLHGSQIWEDAVSSLIAIQNSPLTIHSGSLAWS